MTVINYKASPTGAKFHKSNKFVRGFLGPVGNGKSVTCILEILRLAREQWPNDKGIRKSRWAIIRNTIPELRTTTLNTWKQWVPESIAPVVMHPVITSRLIQPIKADNTVIDLEVYFLALDRDDDVRKLLSLELSGVFINETREIGYAVFKAARERVGRYPARIDGYNDNPELGYIGPRNDKGDYEPCRRKSIIMDTNPPDNDHWWYQLAENGCLNKSENKEVARRETKRIFDFFRGPSPLLKVGDEYEPNPAAENIPFLPGGYQYYLDMIAGNTEDHINVQVMGNYGVLMDGKAVYPQYNDRIHCPQSHFMPIQGLDICLGWDFGLTPACIFGQMTDTGQIRIVSELVSEDMDVRQFARDVVKPYIQKHFSEYQIGFSYADPAGNNRGEGEGKTSIGILNDEHIDNSNGDIIQPLKMGFTTEPAPTNDPTKRQDACRSFLMKMTGSGEPGFIIDKRCQSLRKGFQGGYKYKKIQIGGSEERYREVPDKNKYSHPHDALQYLCLGFAGGHVNLNSSFEDAYEMLYDDQPNSGGYY